MNRKERLARTFAGNTVDRPAVSFYEINGFTQQPDNPDEYNIFNDSSWQPLLALTREKSDVIASISVPVVNAGQVVNLVPECHVQSRADYGENSVITNTTVSYKGKKLTSASVREKNINTTWITEHLLKDADDLKTWLEIPLPELTGTAATEKAFEYESAIGEAGCIMLNTADPLCVVAGLLDMAEYTVLALTEKDLFKRALDKAAVFLEWQVDLVARHFPGRLWRIYGPEYASAPYLPPELFYEYVTIYDKRLVEIIHRNGGYARLHSHGNLKGILDMIVETGCMGLDPLEPPPQGDVELAYVRENYGKDLVLFGNLEASDIENLPEDRFREKIKRAIAEGTAGQGRGFVLMPSACPYGRKLSTVAMKNYEAMIDEIEKL